MSKRFNLVLAAALALLPGGLAFGQSPAKAEDDAYRMAITQVQRGYTMYPATSGIAQRGERVRFLLPITKGVDYVFLVGVDDYVRDVDLYVFDESNAEILSDRRTDRRAGTRFRASYTGTATVYVYMADANGLASWAVLVGTRGGPAQQRINPQTDDKAKVNPGDPAATQPAEGA